MNVVKEITKIITSQTQVVEKMNELIIGINGLLIFLKERDKSKVEVKPEVKQEIKEPLITVTPPKKKVK